MNYQELAQKVKTKYPGQYDDLDDKTLAQKIVSKHPEYSDTTFDSSLIDKVKKVAAVSNKIYQFTPAGILMKGANMAMNAIQKPFDVAGEKTSEFLGSKGVNPNISAGIGTAIQMTPDIAMMAPEKEISFAPKTAKNLASRALGFSKKLLNTPYARKEALRAGQVALENNVIPALGSPEVMMERAQALKRSTGKGLEKIRSFVGSKDITPILEDLNTLSKEMTGFTPADTGKNLIEKAQKIGGTQGRIVDQIQFAKDTLQNLLIKGEKVGLNDVVKAKRELGKTINWLADNATQETHKAISKSVEKSITNILGGSGTDLGKYNYLKKVYGSSKAMINALNNELSRQGNMPINLPNQIIAGGQLMMGNPVKAAATAGLLEAARRRGAGIAANSLYKVRIPIGSSKALLDLSKKKEK